MTTQEVVLKHKLRLNKVDSFDNDILEKGYIIETFNKAQSQVITRLYHGLNSYKEGFESSIKRVDQLQKLITDPTKILVTKKDKYYEGLLPSNYLNYIRTFSKAKSNSCIECVDLALFLEEESNINSLLEDSNKNPSIEWQESLVTISNDKLKVWTNNQFDICEVSLVYLRNPIKIDIEGYLHVDGTPSINVDPEFNDDFVELIIDESCNIISKDLELLNHVQIRNNELDKNS